MIRTEQKTDAAFLSSCQVTYTGTKYAPVTHFEVIGEVGNYIQKANLVVRSERYLAGSNGQKAVGILGIQSQDTDLNFMIAWKNSLDGSMSFKLAFGAQVHVCSNGMFQGDTGNFKRRHTGDAAEDIKTHIEFAIDQMAPTMKDQTEIKEFYKLVPMSKKYMSELVGRLFIERGILTSSQINTVKREIEKPTYDYGAPGTAWELYNHVTLAIRDAHPIEWHDQHKAVGEFFTEQFPI